MFKFKGKPQTLPEIIRNGTALYWRAFTHVWHISLLLAVLASFTPTTLMSKNSSFGFDRTSAVWMAAIVMVLLPVKAFLSGVIIHRLFLVGSNVIDGKLIESARFVANKIIPLSIAIIISNIIFWIGFMAFLVPGFFFFVMLVFVAPLIILDEHTVVEAFQYSWFLVWKSWWRTLAIVIIPAILTIPYMHAPTLSNYLIDVARMTFIGPLLFAMILVGFYDAKLRHHVALNLKKPKDVVKHEET
ncbi:MAG: hypothetical protein M3R00_01375 [Pseudomonadota bacterium]|nr:hypothetical protein [Pseudomonadota bacterium]